MPGFDAAPRPGLLGNPFALLGATTRTPVDELFERADTPEAAAAARALSVPRTRLAAEASFLPGAADRAGAILDDLRAGCRPDPAGLPPLAAANLRAHLCAAGLATVEDLRALALAMPAGADPALVAALDADRAAAGMPPVQPAALAETVEALTDAHAGALVAACAASSDGATLLSGLVEAAAPGRPPPLLRRAAAAWARRTATEAAGLQEAADRAVAAWRASPGPATLGDMEAAVRRWAALTRPQRAVDARAALDHPATVRALLPWRGAIRVAAGNDPAGAAAAARLLAELFGGLPGEGRVLAQEAAQAAAARDEQALAPHLERLQAVVARLSRDVLPLRAELAAHPFGPGLTQRRRRGAAAELWEAFDAAAAASPGSDAAWAVVLRLVPVLDVPPRSGRARGVASFYRGLIARAEADGRTELAARLQAALRARQAEAAVAAYDRRKRGWRWIPLLFGPLRYILVAAAARRALALAEDPAVRSRLEAEVAARGKRARLLAITVGTLAALAVLAGAVSSLDDDYAAHAPFRTHPAVSLAALPAAAPGPPTLPVAPPVAPPVPPPVPAPPRTLAFPSRPGETPPRPGARTLNRAEARWCLGNLARLRGAAAQAAPEDGTALRVLEGELSARCSNRPVRRLDDDAVQADVARDRDRLRAEGEAMLGPMEP